jgi:hypothetical protein
MLRRSNIASCPLCGSWYVRIIPIPSFELLLRGGLRSKRHLGEAALFTFDLSGCLGEGEGETAVRREAVGASVALDVVAMANDSSVR